MNATDYFDHLRTTLREEGEAVLARQQEKYLRYQFPCYGWKLPEVRAFAKQMAKQYGYPTGEALDRFCRLAYAAPERECHYLACWYADQAVTRTDHDYLDLLEWLITHRSWWDTVDWLAKIAGRQLLQFPEKLVPITRRWNRSGHLWLQRSSLIFQRSYREQTRTELLFDYILHLLPTREFFLQKAMGWALRQYSRTDPAAVTAFVTKHADQLPRLTQREALRLL